MDFKSFHLHKLVQSGVDSEGYTIPTEVQAQTIGPIMEGHDVMGLARTGSGKTAAFVLPILDRMMQGRRGRPRALVIAPTRELAEQTHQSIQSLGRHTRTRSMTVYGGVSINAQASKMARGVEVVVGCPGRLLDHLNRGTLDVSNVEILVLDEADHMFDMGFLPDIKRILGRLPRERQTLLFSATMPHEIKSLARAVLNDPLEVRIGEGKPAESVRHTMFPVRQEHKTAALVRILKDTGNGPVLVFTRTKHRAKKLGTHLCQVGYKAAAIQGNLSQNKRQAALDGFRDGRYHVLVATDIAARGIDVAKVSHVINYDVPDTAEAYIHRIGRTGRASYNGEAFTFITSDDKQMVNAIDRVLGAKVKREFLEGLGRESDTVPTARESRPAEQSARPTRPARQARPARQNRPAEQPDRQRPARPGRPTGMSETAKLAELAEMVELAEKQDRAACLPRPDTSAKPFRGHRPGKKKSRSRRRGQRAAFAG